MGNRTKKKNLYFFCSQFYRGHLNLPSKKLYFEIIFFFYILTW